MIKILLFFSLSFTYICFFYYMRKNRVVGNKLKEAYIALDEGAVNRAREYRKKILSEEVDDEKGIKKYINMPYKLYVYSGINRKFKGLTFEIWTVLIVFIAAAIHFGVFAITKNVLKAIMLAGVYIVAILVIEKLMAFQNYKRVGNNLIEFLNLFGNYSGTGLEITNVLYQISKYLDDPLKTALRECYHEVQTTGDTAAALYALKEQIEHPMFRDIINDIVICVKYTANYSEIIKLHRRNIVREQKNIYARRSNVSSFITQLAIFNLFIICTLYFMDYYLNSSVWMILFDTLVGKCCVAFIGVIYIYIWYLFATIEK